MRVALTFDAEHPGRPCPPGGLDTILDTLARRGVRATFFLQGRWARAYPGQARRIVRDGHLIGSHSHHHAPLDGLADAALRRDVELAQLAILDVTGVDPRPLFRCPYGAGMTDERVLRLLSELGYQNVGWDVDPEDWREDRTAERLRALVLEAVENRGDAVVLLHSWPAATADGLDELVGALAAAGAQFTAVDRSRAGASRPRSPRSWSR